MTGMQPGRLVVAARCPGLDSRTADRGGDEADADTGIALGNRLAKRKAGAYPGSPGLVEMHGVDRDDPFVIGVQRQHTGMRRAIDLPDLAAPRHIRLPGQHKHVQGVLRRTAGKTARRDNDEHRNAQQQFST